MSEVNPQNHPPIPHHPSPALKCLSSTNSNSSLLKTSTHTASWRVMSTDQGHSKATHPHRRQHPPATYLPITTLKKETPLLHHHHPAHFPRRPPHPPLTPYQMPPGISNSYPHSPLPRHPPYSPFPIHLSPLSICHGKKIPLMSHRCPPINGIFPTAKTTPNSTPC